MEPEHGKLKIPLQGHYQMRSRTLAFIQNTENKMVARKKPLEFKTFKNLYFCSAAHAEN
jgi:hypothetical protein